MGTKVENKLPNNCGTNGSAAVATSIRKYLVLLQDCLAIKFVSTCPTQSSNKSE